MHMDFPSTAHDDALLAAYAAGDELGCPPEQRLEIEGWARASEENGADLEAAIAAWESAGQPNLEADTPRLLANLRAARANNSPESVTAAVRSISKPQNQIGRWIACST